MGPTSGSKSKFSARTSEQSTACVGELTQCSLSCTGESAHDISDAEEAATVHLSQLRGLDRETSMMHKICLQKRERLSTDRCRL